MVIRAGLAVVGFVLAVSVNAQITFPQEPPLSRPIADEAHLLSQGDFDQISRLSQECTQETGGPIYVATISSLKSMNAGKLSFEQYATALYNIWRIGHASTNNGVLILVSKEDRKARIELGAGWKRSHDAQAQQVMDSVMVPQFRKGSYAAGIVDGAQVMKEVAQGTFKPPKQTWKTDLESMGKGAGFVVAAIFGSVVVLIAVVIAAIRNPQSAFHRSRWSSGTSINTYDTYSSSSDFSSSDSGGSSDGGGASGDW